MQKTRKLFYSTRRSVHEKFKFDFREKEIEIVNQHLPNMLVLKIWWKNVALDLKNVTHIKKQKQSILNLNLLIRLRKQLLYLLGSGGGGFTTYPWFCIDLCANKYRSKQPFRGVLKKSFSVNMQQMYRRTPMQKSDFNIVGKQLN